MQHDLKCQSEYFEAIWTGRKIFELRRDDRNFKVGDWVLLREIETESGYTGRRIGARIRYILRDAEEYGLMPGYCILGLELFQNYRGVC